MLLVSLGCRLFLTDFFSPATSLLGPKKQDCFPKHFILWNLSKKWCKQTSLYIFFQPIKSSVNLKYLGILFVDHLGCRKINQRQYILCQLNPREILQGRMGTFVKRDKLCFHSQFSIDYISRQQYIVIFSKWTFPSLLCLPHETPGSKNFKFLNVSF